MRIKLSVAMPFHFKKTEPPGRAVRRLCRERIRVARECLRHCDRPASVHGARKEIKKLRAALRLVRSGIGRDGYRRTTKALRAAAGDLAAPRDAWVMFKAFEKLTGGSGLRFAAVRKMLRKHCRCEAERFRKGDPVGTSERRLKKAARHVDGLKFRATGWMAIEPGLRKTYRCGRTAFRLVRRQPLPEHFHDWRKHVKNLWYQLGLLCPAWPVPIRAWMKNLERLGSLLGEDHDLTLLKQAAAELRDHEAAEVAALNRLIDARQNRLRADVLKLGRLIYSETPAVIGRRLGKYWSAWHGRDCGR